MASGQEVKKMKLFEVLGEARKGTVFSWGESNFVVVRTIMGPVGYVLREGSGPLDDMTGVHQETRVILADTEVETFEVIVHPRPTTRINRLLGLLRAKVKG